MKLKHYDTPACTVDQMLRQDKKALVDLIILQKNTLASVEDYLAKTLTFNTHSRGTGKALRAALVQLSRVIESTPDQLIGH